VNLSHELQIEAMLIRHGLDTAVGLADADLVVETEVMADRFRELLEEGRGIATLDPVPLRRLGTAFERYDALARRVSLQLIAQTDIADTEARLLEDAATMNAAYEELSRQLAALAASQSTRLESVLSETRDRLLQRVRHMTVLAILAMAGLVVMAAGAIVSIVRPLRKLREATGAIARGDLDQSVDYRADDDLGQLAASFREMQRALEADITRREEIERALRESEQRLALALDAANDGIWDIHLPAGDFYSSDRFAAILGYAPDEKPTTLDEVNALMKGVDPEQMRRLFTEERPDGREAVVEARLRRKDGSWAWVEIKGRTVARDPGGRPMRMVGTISDISARKAAEAELRRAQDRVVQSEKLASLGRMVAGLAHELNSPLGALVSSSDLTVRSAAILRDRMSQDDCNPSPESDPRLQRALAAIQRGAGDVATAAERLQQLLGGLQRFTALDRAELQEADVRELLDTTVGVMWQAQWQDVTVRRDYGEVPRILCHPGQLNQLFLALIHNAVEAMEGRGTLTLRVWADTLDRVHVAIADTGRGIPAAQLEGLFEPGLRRGADRVHLGWGLVTAARIVEEHGGEIRADSEEGRGSIFTVTLSVRPHSLLARGRGAGI
jgi:PAS domain S-box-containing protein